MTLCPTLTPLQEVIWHPRANHSPVLKPLGIAHGFYGRSAPAVTCDFVQQVHSRTVVIASDATAPNARERVLADGLVSSSPGRVLGVRTADCVPLLFADPQRGVVAAVHAGWRGLTGGIVTEAVRLLRHQATNVSNLHVAIGPAISRESFEVGQEVVEAILAPSLGLEDAPVALVLSKGLGDRWHIDLTLLAVLILLTQGILPQQISAMQSCTKQDDFWFSYRREGSGVGSNWAWIKCGI